jgi:hypothetical protein
MPKRPKNDPLTPLFRPAGSADTGAQPANVVPHLVDTRKLGPARAYLNSLGIGAKSQAEVARELDVSVNTLRKLLTNPDLNAPSYIADWGGRQIYIYTPDDVTELREYFTKHRSVAGLRKRRP